MCKSVSSLAVAVLALALSGCMTPGALVDANAKINDTAVATSETLICRGISIAAWLRHYGITPERSQAWQVICIDEAKQLPILK